MLVGIGGQLTAAVAGIHLGCEPLLHEDVGVGRQIELRLLLQDLLLLVAGRLVHWRLQVGKLQVQTVVDKVGRVAHARVLQVLQLRSVLSLRKLVLGCGDFLDLGLRGALIAIHLLLRTFTFTACSHVLVASTSFFL